MDKIGIAAIFCVMFIFFVAVFAFFVQFLVNALFTKEFLTNVFGSESLTYWQALGLFILTSILFKTCSTGKS